MISVPAAIQQIAACRTSWGKSTLSLSDSEGLVLAEPIAYTSLENGHSLPSFPTGTQLSSRHLAAINQAEILQVPVFTPPSVVFIGLTEGEGPKIPQTNKFTVEGALANYGIRLREAKFPAAGSPGLLKAVETSLDADLLILCGNILPKIFLDAGVEPVFNRVKAHPCQAFWFGYSPTKTRVMLMPSNPFAVQVATRLFLESYIRACWSMKTIRPWLLPYAEHRTPVVPQDEYVPAVTVHRNGLKIRATSFSAQTDIGLAAQADGFICHSIDNGSLEPSSLVPFYPWNDPS
ncbi:hypothetical protein WJU16_00685 [Chitinophaga pollutisoli]|uniref:Molybdopterin molybdenumtransferase n=1 Tax=Chitinophaga pollutisoli TaxID=3133966 RepID=A0ABZ2YP61_9BACT